MCHRLDLPPMLAGWVQRPMILLKMSSTAAPTLTAMMNKYVLVVDTYHICIYVLPQACVRVSECDINSDAAQCHKQQL